MEKISTGVSFSIDKKKGNQSQSPSFNHTKPTLLKEFQMNIQEKTKTFENVPKRQAFKTHDYDNVGLKIWVDAVSVRTDFSYLNIHLTIFLITFCEGSQKIPSGSHSLKYAKYIRYIIRAIIIIKVRVAKSFIHYFPSRILQAVLTQPAKDSPSFLACCWINSSKSSSKRIVCLVLFKRSLLLFVFFSCIGYLTSMPRDCNSFRITLFIQPASDSSPSSFWAFSMARRNWLSNRIWKGVLLDFLFLSLLCIDIIIILNYYNLHVITLYVKSNCKTMPRSAGTLSRHLTQPLNGVMIMANRYDNAHLCARQSKLYKFYDLSTAQVVQTTATTERQARKNLGKQSLIFIARKPISPVFEYSTNWGGYAHA